MLKIKAPADYLTQSGSCLYSLKMGNRGGAQSACERALELSEKRSADDLNRLAAAYLLNDKPAKAIPLLQEAMKKAPAYPKVINNFGYCFLLRGQHKKAIGLFQDAIKLDPDFVSARKNLARAYFESGDYKASAEELKALLVISPQDQETMLRLTVLYAGYLGNLKEARNYANKAMSLGLDPQAAQELSLILGDVQEAAPQTPLQPW